MHHLTKILFGIRLTPPGIGGGFNAGEAGLELEERLLSGVMGVVWRKQDVTKMEKVLHLVLEYRKGLRRLSEY
jgi:hypothetical protein